MHSLLVLSNRGWRVTIKGGNIMPTDPNRAQRRADMMQRRIDRFTERRDQMLSQVESAGGEPLIASNYDSVYTTVDPSGVVEDKVSLPEESPFRGAMMSQSSVMRNSRGTAVKKAYRVTQ
jgi:hypothetical protein